MRIGTSFLFAAVWMNDKYRFVPVSDSSVGVNLPHRLKCIDEYVIDVKPEDLKYYNEIRFA